MAPRAQIWYVGRESSRFGILLSLDHMRAVAFFAGRRIWIVPGLELAVGALLILLHHGRVAGCAIDFLNHRCAGADLRRADARVALAASLARVHRGGEDC